MGLVAYDIGSAAAAASVTESDIHDAIEARTLKAISLNGQIRVSHKALKQWIGKAEKWYAD
jgi:hypothetical protein